MMCNTDDADTIALHREHYNSTSFFARHLISSFKQRVLSLIERTHAHTLFEVGCGDGHLSLFLAEKGYSVCGGDVNPVLIAQANKDAAKENFLHAALFELLDVYSYDFSVLTADMIFCCEVLEHLPDPVLALERIYDSEAKYFLFSVPMEPLWCIMNMCRLKYISSLGNTPGHVNHWGYFSFRRFLEGKFTVREVRTSLPWIIALCEKK